MKMDKCKRDLFWSWLEERQFCRGPNRKTCEGCQGITEGFLADPEAELHRHAGYESLRELFPELREEDHEGGD